jgi:hypothetical protein
LICDGERITWHESLAEDKFSVAEVKDEGSSVLFSDTSYSFHLADMLGDGLSNIVRICNGETEREDNNEQFSCCRFQL